jgi:hypothetical protein
MIIIWDTVPFLDQPPFPLPPSTQVPNPLPANTMVPITPPLPIKTIFNPHKGKGVVGSGFSADSRYFVTLGADEPQTLCVWDWTKAELETPLVQFQIKASHQVQLWFGNG